MTLRYRVLPVMQLLLVSRLFILTSQVVTVMKRDGTLNEPLQSIVKPTFNVNWENNSTYQITLQLIVIIVSLMLCWCLKISSHGKGNGS